MTTAPATPTATTTEAPRPRPGHPFTTIQRLLIGIVVSLVLVIAGIGFAGSYAAVSHLAATKGFGRFATVFPIGLDSGIAAFLALDLLLTWLRIPFPLLRYGAWTLTAATVAFNAAAAWPDPLGVGMHAVIPVLFVIAVEAARHATGRIADITADKHTENPPLIRWLCDPIGTFRLWRRMRIWDIRKYEDAITHQRQARIYRAQLRTEYGKKWRSKARAQQLLVLNLATRSGLTITEATELPKAEAARLAEAEAKFAAEAELRRTRTEAEALRIRTEAEAETEAVRRAEAEAKREAEAKQAEAEAAARTEALREAEAARIIQAETEATLAEIEWRKVSADLKTDYERQKYQDDQAARQTAARHAEEQRRADTDRADRGRRAREAEAARRDETETEALRLREAPRAEAKRIADQARTEPASEKPAEPKQAANLGGARNKKQTEVEAVLALITEARDPKAVSLKDVMDQFDLKQAAAWDRLATARNLYTSALQQQPA